MTLDLNLMMQKFSSKNIYFLIEKYFRKNIFDLKKYFFETQKKSKFFIENQYKHFQKKLKKVEKNLEKFEIFSTFSKFFILIFNEKF